VSHPPDGVDVDRAVALLDDAAAHLAFVRIRRHIPHGDPLDGIVLGVSPEWTVIADLYDATFDGYIAFRTADLRSIEVRLPPDPLAIRALKVAGEWPPAAPVRPALGSLAEVLGMAAVNGPILDVQTEYATPDEAYLGRLLRLDDTELVLLQIGSDGDWDPEPGTFDVAEVTRVGFGSRYAQTLYAVGGEPPE